MAGQLAVDVKVDPRDLAELYRAAKAAPGMVQTELRRGIVKAADPVVTSVRAAAAWSTRIPAATRAKASFTRTGVAVAVVVDARRAPEAGPINNRDAGGMFRHPVHAHGDRSQWAWADQTARPFMTQGGRAGSHGVDAAMLRVMDTIAHKLGFA